MCFTQTFTVVALIAVLGRRSMVLLQKGVISWTEDLQGQRKAQKMRCKDYLFR
jgi:hypothetical protein